MVKMSNIFHPSQMAFTFQVPKMIFGARANGTNLLARYYMSYAASMAIMGPTSGLGQHPGSDYLTTRFNMPHGFAEAIFLPYRAEELVPVCPEKLVEITNALGEKTDGLSLREAAHNAAWVIKKLIEDLNLPSNLKDAGVPRESLQEFVDYMVPHREGMGPYAPMRINKENATKLFERAWEGKDWR